VPGWRQAVGARTYLAWACESLGEVFDRTDVVRILTDGGRATGVVASVPGGEITVRARQVALAGGSILSPAVLLRSRLGGDQAGRNLHIHSSFGDVGDGFLLTQYSLPSPFPFFLNVGVCVCFVCE